MLLALVALTFAAFPAPCADSTICWARWDAPAGATYGLISSDGAICDVFITPLGYRKPQSLPVVWWPRSTPNCPLSPGTTRWYTITACNGSGCLAPSDPVDWVGQPQAALEATRDGRGCERGTQLLPNLPRCS